MIFNFYLLVAVVLLIRSSAKKGGKKITAQDLINLTNQDKAKLIDLRPTADFDDGHITGSTNIPFANLDDRAHEIKQNEGISLGASSKGTPLINKTILRKIESIKHTITRLTILIAIMLTSPLKIFPRVLLFCQYAEYSSKLCRACTC